MASTHRARPPRTVLEQLIREWRMTRKEFVEYADQFAREHGESGTLGLRHLQRLLAGHGPNGAPLGALLPDTARLLEHICGMSTDELLSRPQHDDEGEELRDRIRSAARVDVSTVGLLHEQLDGMRRLDRQLGGVVAHEDVCAKLRQVSDLHSHSITPGTREPLAALLAELGTLAAWQALDMGKLGEAWHHYEDAKRAAAETTDPAFRAHTAAEQAFVLLDLGQTTLAAELLGELRNNTACPPLLRAWLAAAHGEAFAADGQRSASLRAFDDAAALLPTEDDANSDGGPYIVLDPVHLARWRGHTLARIGEPQAIDVLTGALDQLDPTFTRAATALHVDLAAAFARQHDAQNTRAHAEQATRNADVIGSRRQLRRLERLTAALR
ncbi:hypothetical protein [Sciscionella marina]|uniref:hypothetical protein n=1 Tax=Sciscionella marina TaxID=508770 RepID=UPI000477773E|nr:hypothetical protein [Sciscionella marina]